MEFGQLLSRCLTSKMIAVCGGCCATGVKNPVQVAGELARQSREPMPLGRVRPLYASNSKAWHVLQSKLLPYELWVLNCLGNKISALGQSQPLRDLE